MIEYADPQLLKLSGLILTVSFVWILFEKSITKTDGKKRSTMFLTKVLLLFCVVAPLYQSYSAKSDIESSSASFKKGAVLKCSIASASYLVSHKSGWKIYGDSFTKDSLLIRGDKCEDN